MKFEKVSEKVYRGEHPLDFKDYKILKDLGVKTILNLERGWFEWFHHMMNKEVCDTLLKDMIPVHLQLGDVFPPSYYELISAVQVCTNPKYGVVYVHCMHGVDRTGLVIAAYQAQVGLMCAEDAIEDMIKKGFHLWSYWW